MNQLKAGVALTYLLVALNNILGLAYTPFLLRMLGQSEFGLYSLISSVVAFLTVLDFGFGNAIVRYTAQYVSEGKKTEQWSLYGMFVLLYVGIGIIVSLLGIVLYYKIDALFSDTLNVSEIERAKLMVILLIINLSVSFPLSVFSSIVIGYERFVFSKFIQILRTIVQPCIMILVLLFGYKAVAMIVIITVLNLFTLLANCFYSLYYLKISVYFNTFNWGLFKEITSYSYYIFGGIIVELLFWNTGQFILGTFVGISSVAVFSIAIQLKAYYSNFSTSISNVFLPKITAMVTTNQSIDEVSTYFVKIGRIQFQIIFLILTGFILFGKSFIELWAGTSYLEAYYISIIIMIPFSVSLIQNIGIFILQAYKRLRFRTYFMLSISSVGVLLNIFFAKLYSGIGIAISIAIILILSDVVMNFYYSKKIGLDVQGFWFEILGILKYLVFVFFIGLCVNWLCDTTSVWILIFKIVFYTIIFSFVLIKYVANDYEKNLYKSLINRFV